MLAAAFLGLLFDGVELGLMPIASLSVSKSLLGDQFTEKLGGEWFAWFSASLLFGAAIGGIVLGNLGDRIGRTRAMGVSILFYSVFAGLGAFAKTQEQMLILRFLVGLGVGGVWPNGMTLVSECWPNASRPLVSGVMSAGLNAGILMLSQLARFKPITPESWQWIFQLATAPAILGLLVMILLPESPRWLASRLAQSSSATDTTSRSKSKVRIGELFAADLRRMTLFGIVLSSVPMVGAWAASKWMIPWAEAVAGKVDPGYKAATQGWWAVGATLGSFFGAQLAHWFGRKRSYLLISLGSTASRYGCFSERLRFDRFSCDCVHSGTCRHSVLRMARGLPARIVSSSSPRNRQRTGLQLWTLRDRRRSLLRRNAVLGTRKQLPTRRRFVCLHLRARDCRDLVRAGHKSLDVDRIASATRKIDLMG